MCLDLKVKIVNAATMSRSLRDKLVEWAEREFVSVGWTIPTDPSRRDKWGPLADPVSNFDANSIPVVLVAMVDGAIAGCIAIVLQDIPHYPNEEIAVDPWFGGFLVSKDHQGKGIGSVLLQAALALCGQLYEMGQWPYREKKLWGFAQRNLHPHLPEWLESQGWVTHEEDFLFKGVPRVVMQHMF